MTVEPTNVLPEGLVRCGECGELKGQGITPDKWRELVPIRCLCEGLICGSCGQERIHRPISNYWGEKDGQVWHMPYFAAQGVRELRQVGLGAVGEWVRRDRIVGIRPRPAA